MFAGPLAGFEGLLVQGHGLNAMPAVELAGIERLGERLAHYHAQTGGEWRAVCSYWSQLYFRTLIIPAAAIVLLGHEPIALTLADLQVVLCPNRSAPVAFVRRPMCSPPDAANSLTSLLDGHLVPFIAAMSCAGRLSPKLLWENAAWPLAFVLQAVIERRPTLASTVAALIDRPLVQPASRGALESVRKTVLGGKAFERRLCCMRDHIPGLFPCAGQCPRVSRSDTS